MLRSTASPHRGVVLLSIWSQARDLYQNMPGLLCPRKVARPSNGVRRKHGSPRRRHDLPRFRSVHRDGISGTNRCTRRCSPADAFLKDLEILVRAPTLVAAPSVHRLTRPVRSPPREIRSPNLEIAMSTMTINGRLTPSADPEALSSTSIRRPQRPATNSCVGPAVLRRRLQPC